MRVAFRVDASPQIGAGHLMRCLVLASELRRYGAELHFVSSGQTSIFGELISQTGGQLHFLPYMPDSQEDALATQEIINRIGLFDWVVVDHYQLDAGWESQVRSTGAALMVIDDLANRKHSCDLLLDQNFYANGQVRYDGLIPPAAIHLLGPSFTLLRSEFDQCCNEARSRRSSTLVKRILVCFGGADAENLTAKVILALATVDGITGIFVDVVVGIAYPWTQSLMNMAELYSWLTVTVGARDMAARMSAADIAIGAGGSMCWERACLGLPSIVLAIADNQISAARDLNDIGFHKYLGRQSDVSPEQIRLAVMEMLSNPNQRYSLSTISRNLVDGRGKERVVKVMMEMKE